MKIKKAINKKSKAINIQIQKRLIKYQKRITSIFPEILFKALQ